MALATTDEEELTIDDVALQFEKEMGHEPHKAQQMLNFCKQNEFPFKYKHIKKWWAKKEAAIEIRKKYNIDADCDAWKVGTWVLIYSRSKKTWFPGKIEREIDDEMLVVKYKKTSKRIQRSNKNLQPFPKNHAILFIVGTKVKIYSEDTENWCNGEIIRIYIDGEGEWLKVKYKGKIADIQRYNKDLMAWFDINGTWNDDIKCMETCDVENIIFVLRNRVFVKEQFDEQIFLNHKEMVVGYFFKNNINGQELSSMNTEQCVDKLMGFLDVEQNKKLQNCLQNMFTLLPQKIKEMFVNGKDEEDDDEDGVDEGKSDPEAIEEQNEGQNDAKENET